MLLINITLGLTGVFSSSNNPLLMHSTSISPECLIKLHGESALQLRGLLRMDSGMEEGLPAIFERKSTNRKRLRVSQENYTYRQLMESTHNHEM